MTSFEELAKDFDSEEEMFSRILAGTTAATIAPFPSVNSSGSSSRTEVFRDSSLETAPDRDPRYLPYSLQMPRVGRRLYVGGFLAATTPIILQTLHITHLLNVAAELEESLFPPIVMVRCVPLHDVEDEDLLRWLPELVALVRQVVTGGGRLAVSCLAGISRSVSVCLAYKVAHEGLSLRQAWEEMRDARPTAQPIVGFWRQLVSWEEQVRGEAQASVLLLPYVSGEVPDLEPYQELGLSRTAHGYMNILVTMFAFHLVWLMLDVL